MAALQQSFFALHPKTPPSSLRSARPSSLRSARPPPRRRLVTMMGTASSSFATALQEIAVSNDSLEATNNDMQRINQLFSDPDVVSYFKDPTVDDADKMEAVDEFASAEGIRADSSNFLKVVIETRRLGLLDDIVHEFESFYNEVTETEVAVVTSVIPLESSDIAQIAKFVQKKTNAKNVRVKNVLDPELIAGFTINYGLSGSNFVDLSIRGRLDDLKEQVKEGLDLLEFVAPDEKASSSDSPPDEASSSDPPPAED